MAVIGGGFAGIEVASAMNEGREVTVIEVRQEGWR